MEAQCVSLLFSLTLGSPYDNSGRAVIASTNFPDSYILYSHLGLLLIYVI